MTDNAHTPGPWRTGDMFNTIFGPPDGTLSPETIATVRNGNPSNARLIAGAPTMLAAAIKVLQACAPLPLNADQHIAFADLVNAVYAATGKRY